MSHRETPGSQFLTVLLRITTVFGMLFLPLSNMAPSFLRADGGSWIPVSDVRNDARSRRCSAENMSDEVSKLCWRISCPNTMYRCAYGACVPRIARCNGTEECTDGSDEVRCDENPQEICSEKEYRCSSIDRCIPPPSEELRNGYAECFNGSDETEEICHEYVCPDEACHHRCLYGGCVDRDVLCDGAKDCVKDGTDEDDDGLCINSVEYACREEEFRCNGTGKRCIDTTRVCDGTRDCGDESEELSSYRGCPDGWFRCAYGACIRNELLCNRNADCYDWSDEEEDLCGSSPLPDGACQLPRSKPATRYTVTGGGCPVSRECPPGRIVPEHTGLIYTCDIGKLLERTKPVCCRNNRWVPSLPTCSSYVGGGGGGGDGDGGNDTREVVTCPPVTHDHRAIGRCQVKWGPHEGWLPCDRPQPVGTQLLLECPPFYERFKGSSSATCLRDGTWNREPLSCHAVCGTREPSVAALIVHGWRSTAIDALPWHATLYSHEDGQWKFFCGGTLIAERAILTAGHCVWKTRAETIKVALGITSRGFEDAMREDSAQLLDVERIELQDSYQDYEGNYGSDLALLILKKIALMNARVHPACLGVGWSSQETLTVARQNGDVGLITGMGLTENDTFSTFLRVASLKIVSDAECRANQSRDFRKYLTYTSFCAGWTNGTGACNGDSGGGLVLRRPNTTIWEVHGVISISPRRLGTSFCDPTYYTVFTKVSSYGEWIRKVVENIPSAIDTSVVNRSPNRDHVQLKR